MIEVSLKKEDINRGYLILVNSENPIRYEEYQKGMRLLPIASNCKGIELEAKTSVLLSQLFKTIGSYNEIVPISGYRDRSEQEQIFKESLLQNGTAFTHQYVALPDRSEHQTGLAIDLAEKSEKIDFIRPHFPYTGKCGDFRRLAVRYGFVERYGKDKEAITQIAHEPWHFRYLGYPHSQIMQEHNLSLEEYIGFIKNYPYRRKHLRIREGAKEIEVFYVREDSNQTTLELSENDCPQISGNNVDGFIITVWR